MKIVLTVASLVPESGGPSRSIPALADALAAEGGDVSVVGLDFGSRFSPPLLPKHPAVRTTLVTCNTPFSRTTRYCREFAQTLERMLASPAKSVVHDNGIWLGTNYLAARLAAATKTPFVVSPRGMLTRWAVRHHGTGKRLAWWLYQKRALAIANLLHATSEDEADDLRRIGCLQPIAIIPNGISLPEADLPPQDSPVRRALFLSRLHPKKGLLDLVAAWNDVRPNGWELVIAGNDENGYATEVKAAIRSAGLGSQCLVVGGVRDEDKWAHYAGADLFVLPSYSENFGLSVGEALGCGVPVITTTAMPWTEVTKHGCGWSVAPGREPLRAVLAEATTMNRSSLREMGARGRLWIRSEFSWGRAARQLSAAYGYLLGTGPRPNCLQIIADT